MHHLPLLSLYCLLHQPCFHKISFTLSMYLGIRLKLLIRDMNVQQFYCTYTSHSLYRVVWLHIDACAGPGRISSHWKIGRISNCVCAGCLKHPLSGGLAKRQWHQCLHIGTLPLMKGSHHTGIIDSHGS